jgi:hypothetical protein
MDEGAQTVANFLKNYNPSLIGGSIGHHFLEVYSYKRSLYSMLFLSSVVTLWGGLFNKLKSLFCILLSWYFCNYRQCLLHILSVYYVLN